MEKIDSTDRETAMLKAIPVGVGQTACCDWCNAALRPNADVEVYVTEIDGTVSVSGTRCAECSRGEIATGTLGATEWVAHGTLAPGHDSEDRSQLVLEGVEVVDKSGPSDGTEP